MICEEAVGEFEHLSEMLHAARSLRANGRPRTADAQLRAVERKWPGIEAAIRRALLQHLGKADPRDVARELARIVHEHDAGPRAPEDAA